MKPCPYCAESIQDEAKKCRFCGEWLEDQHEEPVATTPTIGDIEMPIAEDLSESNQSLGERNVTAGQVLLVLGALIFFVLLIWNSNSSPRSSRSDTPRSPRYSEFDAQVRCERFVKDRLKAPRTAKFAPHRELSIRGSGAGPWTVRGWVDAENSFGAMIRNRYNCTVRFEESKVLLEALDVQP